jgi:hypothetical protein
MQQRRVAEARRWNTPTPVTAPARPLWSATGSAAVLKVGRQPWRAGVLPHYAIRQSGLALDMAARRFDRGDGL